MSAPQIIDSKKIYQRWLLDHNGSLDDFFLFMTSSSVERDSFIASLKIQFKSYGSVIAPTVSNKMTLL